MRASTLTTLGCNLTIASAVIFGALSCSEMAPKVQPTCEQDITDDSYCLPGPSEQAMADEMIAEQIKAKTVGLTCVDLMNGKVSMPSAPKYLVVRGAKFDKVVVSVLSFDSGWAAAKAGDAWIIAACS